MDFLPALRNTASRQSIFSGRLAASVASHPPQPSVAATATRSGIDEKPAAAWIVYQSSMRNQTPIISMHVDLVIWGIRTNNEPSPVRRRGRRVAPRGPWAVVAFLVRLNGGTDQTTRRGTGNRAEGGTANTVGRQTPDDRAGSRTDPGALAGRRVTSAQRQAQSREQGRGNHRRKASDKHGINEVGRTLLVKSQEHSGMDAPRNGKPTSCHASDCGPRSQAA